MIPPCSVTEASWTFFIPLPKLVSRVMQNFAAQCSVLTQPSIKVARQPQLGLARFIRELVTNDSQWGKLRCESR